MRRLTAALAARATQGIYPGAPPPAPPAPPPPVEDYLSDPYYNDPVAFRGAMGYGANTTGGRGNGTLGDTQLLFVDNLNDSGAGSLRAALEATGKRVIVPRVGGVVPISTRINVTNATNRQNVTFLGQLAPGGGLAVRHASLPAADNFTLIIWGANNTIVRYLRLWAGEGINIDGIGMSGGVATDMIMDHVSTAFGTDEVLQLWGGMERITVQNCIIGEALAYNSHPYGVLLGPRGVKQTSLLYNLITTGTVRYPYYKNDGINQFVGNVIYNSLDNCQVYVGEEATLATHVPHVDMVNNTWLAGPRSTSTDRMIRFRNQATNNTFRGRVYLRGNKSWQITNEASLEDQWAAARIVDSVKSGTLAEWRSDIPLGSVQVNERTRADAMAWVYAKAGASLSRDSLDARFVSEAVNNTGRSANVNTVSAAGGYPTIASGTYPTCADGVISDAWRASTGETRPWYALDTGGTKRMIVENYADDVADGLWAAP